MHPKLCCPEILNAIIEIFPACCNAECKQKVTIFQGEKLVHCSHCTGRMKPASCVESFEGILEFQNVTLSLPLAVVEEFLGEKVIPTYQENIDVLIEKLLYFEKVDYQHNSKNVITKMSYH